MSESVRGTRTRDEGNLQAGLRGGWCFAPAAICDMLNRVRGPFNTNDPAMRAGIAAIGDAEHTRLSVEHNERWLARLAQELGALGFVVTPSVANFMLVHFVDLAEAQAADAFFTARGLILRAVGAYGLPQCLRLSVGTDVANELVIEAFAAFATTRTSARG